MIETDRLRLRPLTRDDVAGFCAIWTDAEVIWWGAKSADECPGFLDDVIARTADHPELAWFAVVRKRDGLLVGDIALEPAAWDDSLVEIGWHVARAAQGQGYATEAAQGVIGYARAHGLTHVEASIVPENTASGRVAEKLGMTRRYRIDRAGLDHDVWVLDLD